MSRRSLEQDSIYHDIPLYIITIFRNILILILLNLSRRATCFDQADFMPTGWPYMTGFMPSGSLI